MSRYTLSINIKSDSKELLDNLMVTLETIQGNIADVDAVELFTTSDSENTQECQQVKCNDPTTMQRNLFLDKWVLSEGV
ncbi:MAG: hypothetical protein GC149_14360 [Gammaproteobacteria bacterium]|nr:hypothetical protein [Gammaproteobacteria bacterium]